MKTIELKVKTKTQEYPILIGSNLAIKLGRIIEKNSIYFNKCLIVVDKKVPKKLFLKIRKSFKRKKVYVYFINANEKNKNLKTINRILKVLLDNNFSRQDCLIALGGGITGDIVGFVASIFKRGLQFINVPTTLL